MRAHAAPASNDDTRVPIRYVRQRFGGVSHMWIERRLKDDPTFPRPIYIAGRRFWSMQELVAWEKSRPRSNRMAAVA